MLFRAQAEVYRTYHMRDPESYYNRADLWDLATFTTGQGGGGPQPVTPTYMVATLPGESEPEFLLMVPFTPRAKQNLIGLMVARCDGPHLGELLFLALPKQEVIQGPLQVEALINQDQNISKDLTLWNQQGSQVLRSQILTLPIDQTSLYVAPIYIQASEARMPQLKKVALAMGNTLVYADTYEQALADLEGAQKGRPAAPVTAAAPSAVTVVPAATSSPDSRIEEIRAHLSPTGVVCLNTGHTRTDYRLVQAFVNTLHQVFPSVYVFNVPDTFNTEVMATVSPTSLDTFRASLQQAAPGSLMSTVAAEVLPVAQAAQPEAGGIVFTDDRAPIEQLTDQLLLSYIQQGP